MAPVEPRSYKTGIRLSPDAVIEKFRQQERRALREASPESPARKPRPSDIVSMADACREKKQFNLAEGLLMSLLDGKAGNSEQDELSFLHAMFYLGICYHGEEKYGDAARWYISFIDQASDNDFLKTLARGNLADVLCALGRYEESEALFMESLEVLKPLFSQGFPSCPYYHMLNNYAELLEKMDRQDEAARVKEEADAEEDLFWFCWVRCS